MAKPNSQITAQEVPLLLAALACENPDMQQETLRSLCPCRTRCYDREVWTAICRAYDDPSTGFRVQHQALHALETLVEHARTQATAHALLDWLCGQGLLTLPLEPIFEKPNAHPTAKKAERRLTAQDVPRLLEILTCGDPASQERALHLACPCRNRFYDRELWLAIFRAYEEGENGTVRDGAAHAIGTLRERARTDPRSQKLLLWLASQGITALAPETAVPVWQPNLRGNGLYIPRFERSARSRSNRRR